MPDPWQEILSEYRAKRFEVITREDLFRYPYAPASAKTSISEATHIFLQQLSRPDLTPWQALWFSVQSVHPTLQQRQIPGILLECFQHISKVAVLYGDHFAWKSPDKWKYLFEMTNPFDATQVQYLVIHAPATLHELQQAEAVLGMTLPPSYKHLLMCSNGLGLGKNEISVVLGAGPARADWDAVLTFPPTETPHPNYHEICWCWLSWQEIYAYERQRDREEGVNSFLSDERVLVPFASTYDAWCFDRSQRLDNGEYTIVFWDHELREATYSAPDIDAWLREALAPEE